MIGITNMVKWTTLIISLMSTFRTDTVKQQILLKPQAIIYNQKVLTNTEQGDAVIKNNPFSFFLSLFYSFIKLRIER